MKRLILHATLSAVSMLLFSISANAQPRDNFVSEADRQRSNFERAASSDYLMRQGIERARGATSGVGVTVRAPSSLSAAPPQRRAATFGVGTAGSSGVGGKPFSSVMQSPTVSPYMNLFRTDLSGNDDLNYQTLVQPQLRQMEFNRQVNIQEQQITRRVQAIAAQNAFAPRGSTSIMPTGHGAAHRYYSHYYPGMYRRR